MTKDPMSTAMQRFVDYFGELGPRWGLPAQACRVHAYLYLLAIPIDEKELAVNLSLDSPALANALTFLLDYRMVARISPSTWQTSADPWDMLMHGLEERRQRELPEALAVLQSCHQAAMAERPAKQRIAAQIGKMLGLVQDLAAINAQAQRISPHLMRGLVGISGRAARFMDRALGGKKR